MSTRKKSQDTMVTKKPRENKLTISVFEKEICSNLVSH